MGSFESYPWKHPFQTGITSLNNQNKDRWDGALGMQQGNSHCRPYEAFLLWPSNSPWLCACPRCDSLPIQLELAGANQRGSKFKNQPVWGTAGQTCWVKFQKTSKIHPVLWSGASLVEVLWDTQGGSRCQRPQAGAMPRDPWLTQFSHAACVDGIGGGPETSLSLLFLHSSLTSNKNASSNLMLEVGV